MTFHSIVRQWCRIYRPMMDGPKNRRFYLTDSQQGVVELAKKISNKLSPCVVMESGVEGGGPLERPSRNYPIYFFVRARDMADGDAAAEAKEEAWQHAKNFLVWLRAKREKEMEENADGDFARIDMDGNIDIMTLEPVLNGWFAVLVQLERDEPLNLCINEDLYCEEYNDNVNDNENQNDNQ